MYNEEFTSKEQLEELEKKADELNALIKKLKNKNRLVDYCMLRPLNTPRNIKDDIPVFGFKDLYDTEVWNCFCKLAKAVHNDSDEFYMSTAYPGSHRKYIRSNTVPNPKKFEELTMEQMELSGKMVDEMIAIYNKYFIFTHIIAHHPFVSDVEEELKALEEQREAEGPAWDIAPSVRDDGDGEE